MMARIGATLDLAIYGFLQIAFWLTTGRTHHGFDGLWRYRFELGEIWKPTTKT